MSRRKTKSESPRDRLLRLLRGADLRSQDALSKWLLHQLPENLLDEWEMPASPMQISDCFPCLSFPVSHFQNGNGKRVETKLETSSLPQRSTRQTLGFSAHFGNELETNSGDKRVCLAALGFQLPAKSGFYSSFENDYSLAKPIRQRPFLFCGQL